MPQFLSILLSRPVIVNAVKVSLVVGFCLNAINQGPTWWRGGDVEWGKFLLNFAVPYLVASYSAAKARQGMES